jgi:hypothetical protein
MRKPDTRSFPSNEINIAHPSEFSTSNQAPSQASSTLKAITQYHNPSFHHMTFSLPTRTLVTTLTTLLPTASSLNPPTLSSLSRLPRASPALLKRGERGLQISVSTSPLRPTWRLRLPSRSRENGTAEGRVGESTSIAGEQGGSVERERER